MSGFLRNPVAILIGAFALLIALLSSVVIVGETDQAVILRLQQPLSVLNAYQKGEEFGNTRAGVYFRIPLIDRVVWVDKRILDIDLDKQPVLSTDQLRLEVDAYARFRVVDPLKMAITIGSTERLTERLQPLFSSALRSELGKEPFAALLSAERGQVMGNIQANLQKLASQYGVQVIDVRITHADLPAGSPLDLAYQRMRSARQQEAETIKAQGLKDAQIIRATADAQAAQIYAEAFNKDPGFYDFWRGMKSYQTSFLYNGADKGDTNIILSPNNSYLKQFVGGGQR